MAATARLNGIWRCNTISFANKIKLYKSLVISVVLYGCETWTLLADYEKRIQVFETKCMRKLPPQLLLGARDQRLGAERDQLPCESAGTSSDNCQETETCLIVARHLGGWATPWSAEEMLDGQHHRADIPPCPCQNYLQRPLAEKTRRGSLRNRPICPPDDPIGHGNELN